MILIGFFFYFFIVGVIALSVYFYNKKRAQNNYAEAVLAGRSVNYVLTAFSAQASDMSDWLFMAFPAAIYSGGIINAWIGVGLIFGMFVTWRFIAAPLRAATERYNALTIASFFEKRFSDSAGIIRIGSALLSVIFFSVYLAAGMKGFGFLAESVFHLPYELGTFVAIFCVIVYITLGGYRALAWIDCFQAIFLFLVIFIVPTTAFFRIGGISELAYALSIHDFSFNFFPQTCVGWINTIVMALSWSVGYFGMPHILTKFMGIDDVRKMRKAQYIGMSWQGSVLFAAGTVGVIGVAYFPYTLSNSELVFVEMVLSLYSRLVAGFILSAVAGATLSVMTAQVLVLVSVMTEDFYRLSIKPTATDAELLWVYRISVVLAATLGFLVSLQKAATIQSFVAYAWIGFGCSFGPLVLLSLYSTFVNRYGAYATLCVGGSIAVFWQFLLGQAVEQATGLRISAVVPGFILSIIASYVVSYMTQHRVDYKV